MNVLDDILKSTRARKIFDAIEGLPILDYHCHLEAKDIYENKPFNDLVDIWLKHDHYKWRLMRLSGIHEDNITGSASNEEKFNAYVCSIENSLGNPTREWSLLELNTFFGINEIPTQYNSLDILKIANKQIIEKQFSPQKILNTLNVKYIATTDDPTSELFYHKQLKNSNFAIDVAPTFRVDRCFNIRAGDFADYINTFTGHTLSFKEFLEVLKERASYFKECGCLFSDIGIEMFPHNASEASFKKAENAYNIALTGRKVNDTILNDYISYLYIFWFNLCINNGFIVQLHLGVIRNSNSLAYDMLGPDSGFDIAGSGINIKELKDLFNVSVQQNGEIPSIIAYVLNPISYHALIVLAGAFTKVSVGVPWWFNDHKRGLVEYFKCISTLSNLSTIPGMTTDGRSYLAYVRHAYFRAILANYLAKYESEDFTRITNIAKRIAYYNMAARLDILEEGVCL
ncbi:MAG: glucuronate isomerase [Christensenellaceae bacterium]|jgi:glucuronate isomerase|nr:glucuronate isomerase [Christensenellaceae bacterium]